MQIQTQAPSRTVRYIFSNDAYWAEYIGEDSTYVQQAIAEELKETAEEERQEARKIGAPAPGPYRLDFTEPEPHARRALQRKNVRFFFNNSGGNG